MTSIQAKEGVIKTDQQKSKKVEPFLKTVKSLERFTLIIGVILTFGLLVHQGSICISK